MDIQFEKEQKSAVEFEVKVTVPAAEMTERVESGLTAVARKANIPGFRKGKIPRKILVKQFGEAVTQETIQQVLQESYRQALTESDIIPAAPGEMSEINFNQGEPLTYTVKVETFPEYELPDLATITMEEWEPQASEKDIDASLEGLRENSATLIPTDDPVDEHSVVVIDVQEVDKTGIAIIGRNQKDLQVDMQRQYFGEDFAAKITGKQCEDKFIFELIGGADEKGEPKKIPYEGVVRNIQRKELPEIDEHFVQSINPNLNTVEELRADLKKYLEARAKYQARQQLYRAVADELLKRVDFPVPPRMLEDYLDRMAEDGVKSAGKTPDEEQVKKFKENYRTSAIWNLRWYMLRSRLIQEKELKVDKQDIKTEIERLALMQQVSPKEYESRLTPDQRQGIEDDLIERRVFDYITNQIQVTPKQISIEEFEAGGPGSKIVNE
ncbi:trigger factor [bacterium]|nr:trigger factor [bacterium]